MAKEIDFLTDNINLLIEASGLTDESFSNMMGFSIRKLKYIKKGESTLKLAELSKVSSFFHLKDLATKKVIIEGNIRNKLLNLHKGNKEYKTHLEEAPTIIFAIKYSLLLDDVILNPTEIRNIRDFFKGQGWQYNSSAISTALKRLPNLVRIQDHPTKKGTFVYSKK